MPDTTATPEMTQQLSALPEVDVDAKTGEPLNAQNQADPSQAASNPGAPAEPAGSPPETPSQPPAPEAAPAVVEAPPVVAPPAEGLQTLADALTTEREKSAEEARRTAQSQSDRQNAQFARQMEAAKAQSQELTQKLRELETRDLSDAERATIMEKYAQDDQRTELDSYRDELLAEHRNVYIDSLVLQYRDDGVTREELDAIEAPEEMELHCANKSNALLREKLEQGQTAPAAAPETTAQPAAAAPEPNVPAGVHGTTDIGGAGVPAEEKTFSKETGQKALLENLQKMSWETPKVTPR